MRTAPGLFLVLALSPAGCGLNPGDGPPAVTLEPVGPTSPAAELPSADNLDYLNWSRFQPGTTVKRKSVTRIGDNETVSVDTFTLIEADGQKVVVERQNTTERSDGSYRAVNPPERRTYARSFKVPAGMKAEDLQKPALAAREAGEETVPVCGKEYKARVFTWTDRTEAGDMPITVWLCDDVPGRIVKQEMKVPAIRSHTLEEVIAVVTP